LDEHINNYVIKKNLGRRISENKNCLILVVGGTGSGKSYFSLDIASQLDPSFSIDRCCWDAVTFSKLISARLPSGSAIIGDELGVFMSARDWNKKENKALSKALQTIRFMNHYIFFTVPKLSMVDVNARQLFHFIVVAKGRIRGKTNVVDFHRLSENPRRPESSPFRNPFFCKIKGELKQISSFYSRLPPKDLIDEYEARRSDKIHKMLEKNLSDIGEQDDGAKVYYCSRCKITNDENKCKRCGDELN